MQLPIRFRWSRGRIALAVALACALLLSVFEWTWFRPLIQHVVYERSGRSVDFDELRIGLTRSLEPTVQLRGLLIQNAAWAAKRPFVRAGQVTFTFSWRSFSEDHVILTRVVLVDAEVDLEHQANGLRNWRLIHPEERGPQRIKVHSLDAQRSEVRFVHGGLDLDVDARISALEPAQALTGHPELPLTKWLVFRGTRAGKAFSGQTAASEVLTFVDTATPFALRGQAQTGRTRLKAEGIAADILTLAEMDLDLHLAADSLAELRPFLPTDALPASRPTVVEAHLNKVGAKWTASRLHATVGHTDLNGDVSFSEEHEAGRRPMLRATLSGAVVDAEDIGPLIGMGSSPSGDDATAAPAEKVRHRAASTASERGDRVLPQRPFNATRLRTFDGEIELRIARLITAVPGSAQSLRMRATLQDGALNINPFDLGIAGGHATGTLLIDGARTPAEVALDLELRGLRLDQFSPAGKQQVAGELRGRIALRSHGDSIAALAGAASGSLSAALSGATISNRLDAKLGLDGGGLLRALLTGTERVPVQCAALVVDFKRGNGKTRRLLFETERTALAGIGSVNLARESFDLVLTPHSKKSALFALHKAMRVSGSFRDAKVALVDPGEAPWPDPCEIDGHVPVAQLAPGRSSEQRR